MSGHDQHDLDKAVENCMERLFNPTEEDIIHEAEMKKLLENGIELGYSDGTTEVIKIEKFP